MKDLYDDDIDDGSRYETARGWQPEDKFAKLRAEARKKDRRIYELPFETLSGAEIPQAKVAKPPAELFGELWREGEVALLLAGRERGRASSPRSLARRSRAVAAA
jgi:hypothetical protein